MDSPCVVYDGVSGFAGDGRRIFLQRNVDTILSLME